MTTSLQRRLRLLPALLVAAIILGGCIEIEIDGDGFGHGEDGSGVLIREERTVSAFSAIEVSGALRIELDRGPLRIELEFDDNLIDQLETVIRGSELRIACPDCSPSSQSIIRLAAPNVTAIDVSGASRVVARDINEDSLNLSVSGASKIEIDGTVRRLVIDGSGASNIEGHALTADRLEISLSGASRAEVTVVDRAEGDLSGASYLSIAGSTDPSVAIETSGGSSVDR